MRFFVSSSLTTALLTFLLVYPRWCFAASFSHISKGEKPVIIASVPQKVQEYITNGMTYLNQGNYYNFSNNKVIAPLEVGRYLLRKSALASEQFTKALRLDPGNATALYGRGLAHLQIYLQREFIPNYRASMGFPGYPPLPQSAEFLNPAINDLGAVTRKNPPFAPAFLELGQALLMNGNYPDAIKASQRAIDLGTTQKWRAYTYIGSAYYQLMLKNPSPQAGGPDNFVEADKALGQAANLNNPWTYVAYDLLARLHRQADKEFGYEGASITKANEYQATARRLYLQTPAGKREQARQRKLGQLQQQQQVQQRQAAREAAWRNRPCTPDYEAIARSSALFDNVPCKEGWYDPKSAAGKSQPMPSTWQP